MTMNVYFPSFTVHFKPISPFTVSPQQILKKMCWINENEPATASSAIFALRFLNIFATAMSYLASPNILIPLQMLNLIILFATSSGLTLLISSIFSLALLFVTSKYTDDGTLHKLSFDMSFFAKEGEMMIRHINQGRYHYVTFNEPPLILSDPLHHALLHTLIYPVNAVIKSVFDFYIFCFATLSQGIHEIGKGFSHGIHQIENGISRSVNSFEKAVFRSTESVERELDRQASKVDRMLDRIYDSSSQEFDNYYLMDSRP
jgi:hypothetical protein